MVEIIVPLEAPTEVAYLLYQAARDGCLTSKEDAKIIWKASVLIAATNLKELNNERRNTGTQIAEQDQPA